MCFHRGFPERQFLGKFFISFFRTIAYRPKQRRSLGISVSFKEQVLVVGSSNAFVGVVKLGPRYCVESSDITNTS